MKNNEKKQEEKPRFYVKASPAYCEKETDYYLKKGIVKAYCANGKETYIIGFRRISDCVFSDTLNIYLMKIDYIQYFLGEKTTNNLYREFALANSGSPENIYSNIFSNKPLLEKYRSEFLPQLIELAKANESDMSKQTGFF